MNLFESITKNIVEYEQKQFNSAEEAYKHTLPLIDAVGRDIVQQIRAGYITSWQKASYLLDEGIQDFYNTDTWLNDYSNTPELKMLATRIQFWHSLFKKIIESEEIKDKNASGELKPNLTESINIANEINSLEEFLVMLHRAEIYDPSTGEEADEHDYDIVSVERLDNFVNNYMSDELFEEYKKAVADKTDLTERVEATESYVQKLINDYYDSQDEN